MSLNTSIVLNPHWLKMKFYSVIVFLLFLFSGNQISATGISLSPKIDSIQLYFDDQQLILPGESFRIGIISYYKNGKVRKTVGMQGGSVWWIRFKVEVTGGTDFNGWISVNEELIPAKEKYIAIRAFPRKQAELAKELLLPLNYETKISYRPTSAFDKAPGSLINGELVSEFNNGMIRVCTNLRNSKESGNFRFLGNGGVWKNGKFIVESDFRNIEKHRAEIVINSLRNREVSDTFSVQLDINMPTN